MGNEINLLKGKIEILKFWEAVVEMGFLFVGLRLGFL